MNCFELDKTTNTKLLIFLLKDVKNIKSLKSKIITGELDCCAVKPSLVINFFQIIVAANKAAKSKIKGKLKTKSLNTELLYNLSPSKNITQSLNTFGIDDRDKNIVIVIFEENDQSKFDSMKTNFEGEICGIEEVEAFSDVAYIKKTYKITDQELEVSSLINSVVSRISIKDFGSY